MRAERMLQQQQAFSKQQERMAHLQKLHRPLQGQGHQGQAGAKPRQGAGAHGEARTGADRVGLQLRVPRAAEPAQPDADVRHGLGGLRHRRGREGHRARHRPLGAGGSAFRHPGRERPGQVHFREDRGAHAARNGRHHHRGQGPVHRLLRPAGAGRAAARRRPADAHDPAGQGGQPGRARAGAARLPRSVPLRRRHGQPGSAAACPAARRRGWCWR